MNKKYFIRLACTKTGNQPIRLQITAVCNYLKYCWKSVNQKTSSTKKALRHSSENEHTTVHVRLVLRRKSKHIIQ